MLDLSWPVSRAPSHAVFPSSRYLTPKVWAFIGLALDALAGAETWRGVRVHLKRVILARHRRSRSG
jgi:hypothetical protein